MKNRIFLTAERSITQIRIYPANWLTTCKKDDIWRISYRYFDDRHLSDYPNGFQVVIKEGFPAIKTIADKRKYAKELIRRETDALNNGYNPITGNFDNFKGEISIYSSVIDALFFAHSKLEASDKHKNEVRIFINRFAKHFDFSYLTIRDLKRREVLTTLDRMKLTPSVYNKGRSYLSSLIGILIKYDIFEFNFIKEIDKKPTIKKLREVIPMNTFLDMSNYLKKEHYNFYRYLMIFFFSGSRTSELLRLKKEDVNLEKMEFKMIIRKGKLYTEVRKPITTQAMPFWTDIVQKSLDGQYLFSKDLLPNNTPIKPYQITKRWYRLVKCRFGITEDFYSLKHLFLMQLANSLTPEQMRAFSGHTNNKILQTYLVDREVKQNEILKNINIELV